MLQAILCGPALPLAYTGLTLVLLLNVRVVMDRGIILSFLPLVQAGSALMCSGRR